MARYVAKPVEIEAVLWRGHLADLPADWLDSGDFTVEADGTLLIQTLEGPARALVNNHYVACGTAGEFYPIRHDIFHNKYEAVGEQ
jgi:hypothetical protein